MRYRFENKLSVQIFRNVSGTPYRDFKDFKINERLL